MSIGPYPIERIVQQLETVPALRFAGVAADLQTALNTAPNALPAAYVVLREDGNKPQGYTETHVQRINAALIVVLWSRNYRAAATGSAAAQEMTALETSVRTALIAYTPDPAIYEPLWLAGNQDNFNAGALVRQVAFASEYRLQV